VAFSEAREALVGLDIGASIVKAVATVHRGGDLRVQIPVTGTLRAAVAAAFEALKPAIDGGPIRLGVTGQGRNLFEGVEACAAENEVLCLVRGLGGCSAQLGSVIEIGGQTARWVRLSHAPDGTVSLSDFSLNDQCAAGVGAFLVQQASRLQMSVEELARVAAQAPQGASIAGRCAVFAKSDMIHLQQRGASVEEIAYGLCLALARNFLSTVLRGKEPALPVGMAGGGALNPGLVRAFREVLGQGDATLIALPDPLFVGAEGARRLAAERAAAVPLRQLLDALGAVRDDALPDFGRRVRQTCLDADGPEAALGAIPAGTCVDVFLGIDVGSVSTDLALISPEGELLDGIYLPTRGRPVEVLREALSAFGRRHGERLKILGAGTTGSGRHLAARLVGADLAKNEITAQLAGTLHFFPDADTVFEIGGQDSKFISVEAGRLADFTMNKVCAAGTGSFLEEQCDLLGLDVKSDFAHLAAQSSQHVDLGARCTVFMETELSNAARGGASLPDLTAALADSVARNYLQKVVGHHAVGSRVVFQGGVASNAAVVAAFERLLGRKVHVHPHNTLSGAIGVALLARDALGGRATSFKGLACVGEHTSRSFVCRQCENRCEVTRLEMGDAALHFGDTCERYTIRDRAGHSGGAAVPDLFVEREALLAEIAAPPAEAAGRRGLIGLPRASIFCEYLPFWSAFFRSLGFDVRVSPPSSMAILERGTRHVSAETCLPIKMAFGHVAALRDVRLDAIFFPSIVSMEDSERPAAHGCPYSQAAPFMVRAAIPDGLLAPEVQMSGGFAAFADGMAATAERLGLGPEELRAAYGAALGAQEAFRARLVVRGREVLAGDFERGLVVVGRPYNLFDPFLNLNLSRHLARLGVVALPQSFLPVDGVRLPGRAATMPWRFPREALRTALSAADDARLHPVLVTNFGCGPDAFLLRHLAQALPERDILTLEFDEHRGEAGMVTRVEAFLDRIDSRRAGSVGGHRTAAVPGGVSAPPGSGASPRLRGQKTYIPYFADHAVAFQGALHFVGSEAELLPLPDDAVRAAGEEAGSGKECHPYSLLLGDLLGVARRHRDGPHVSYLYPGTSIPCLLAQFSAGFEVDMARQGLRNVTIVSPWSRQMLDMFGIAGATQLWRGIVTTDLLIRWACQTRPYEREPGATDRVHRENLRDLSAALARDDLPRFCDRAEERMRSVGAERGEPRPLVGIAGDIYTRANDAANLGLWHRLEALGCEVWPAPLLIDNVDFGLPDEVSRSMRAGRYRDALVAAVLVMRKDWTAWPLRRRLGRLLDRPGEPGHGRTLDMATRYVGRRSQQFYLLNVAKMVDFAEGGADGIVHAMCLNCMMGTASVALIDRIRADHGGIPIANLVYAGTDNAALQTKIEAFVHQVKAHSRRPAGLRPA
jgi:predicted CoA-substrate-specific enzyme activase